MVIIWVDNISRKIVKCAWYCYAEECRTQYNNCTDNQSLSISGSLVNLNWLCSLIAKRYGVSQ